MTERRNTGRSRVATIVAALAGLLLVSVIAGPVLAQSPSPAASPAATVEASPAASPGGVAPSPTQPDTATGFDSDPRTTGGDISPLVFLLLGIGAVAAVLVFLGMRGSQLGRAPAGSDTDR